MSNEYAVSAVSSGQGVEWIRAGFGLFRASPWIWIGIMLVMFALQMVGNVIPFGGLVMAVIGPVFGAGILFGCRDLQLGTELTLGHLFAGFRSPRAGALVLLGVLILLLCLFAAFAISILATMLLGGVDLQGGEVAFGSIAVVTVISLVIVVPVAMALWFATPLAALHEMEPVAAMKASLAGCVRNIAALTVYGLLLIPLGILAMIPFGLGLLILAPTIAAANYISYQQIYEQDREVQPAEQNAPLID